MSVFLERPVSDHIASNDLAFAIFDGFPVSPGHALLVPRRVVPTWFDATREEQSALMALIDDVKRVLDARFKPDGYNIGINAGVAAGQTVMHVHVHLIPRYHGDVPDPRGGIRHLIPGKGNYLIPPRPASD
ncbi:MAG: HIT family protein [Myxococcales bacterium]|nr:HIT family protein [Myxococcales bacterium]